MANLVAEKHGEIYYDGKTLNLIVEYYRTVVWVYYIDKRKYFPVVDKVKFKRNRRQDVILRARDYAIDNNLF